MRRQSVRKKAVEWVRNPQNFDQSSVTGNFLGCLMLSLGQSFPYLIDDSGSMQKSDVRMRGFSASNWHLFLAACLMR